jgi:carboxymethylenebutenolidase
MLTMAQAAAPAGIASEPVQFPGDGITVTGFLARPIAQPPFGAPALLLLHEWWGLNEQIKGVARRFAEAGFAALAPDLYSRQNHTVTDSPQEAAVLMNALSSQWALLDLNAATRYLKSRPFVDPLRVGIVGFSMGGMVALNLVGHNSDLKAAVAFYAKVPPLETVAYHLCPVQFHHAGKDAWVTRKEVDTLRQGLEQTGKSGDIHIYPEADHGFFNETRPDVYRAQDAALAWERALAFLRRQLG